MKLSERNSCKVTGIYCITNLISGHKYIGQARNICNRIYEHINCSTNEKKSDYNSPLHIAFRKYGIDNFDITILETCKFEELDDKEIYWIKYYHTFKEDPEWSGGYNLTAGGLHSVSPRKLTAIQVNEIKHILATTKMLTEDISQKYGVTHDFINRINVGNAWHDNDIDYPIRKDICRDPFVTYRGYCVLQLNKETGEVIAKFPTIEMAGKLATADPRGHTHISAVVNHKRNSAYGFKWELEEMDKEDWLKLYKSYKPDTV